MSYIREVVALGHFLCKGTSFEFKVNPYKSWNETIGTTDTDILSGKREMRLKRIHNHLRSLIRPYLFIDYDGKIALTPKTLYMKDIERDILIQKLVSMQNECTDSKARTKYTPLIEAISNKIRGLSDNDLEIIKNSYATSTT